MLAQAVKLPDNVPELKQVIASLQSSLEEKEQQYTAPLVQIDETTVQGLKEPGRENTAKSYRWLFRGGPPEPTLVFQ